MSHPQRGLARPRAPVLAALAAGGVHALSFAPGPLPAWLLPWWQVVTLALLAGLCSAAPPRRAAQLGGCFGFCHFGIGLYWLYISLHHYGHLAAPLAVLAVAVLAAALAVFPLLACSAAAWLAPRSAHATTKLTANFLARALVWAACWTLTEWLRGTLLTGFPWLNVGYAHIDGPYAGWAAGVGVYGVAFWAAFAACALGGWVAAWGTARRAATVSVEPTPSVSAPATALVVAALAAATGSGLARIEWANPHGAPLEVRLVQGNIAQSDKFDPAQIRPALAQQLAQAALPPVAGAPEPMLIVLPETIIPVFQHQLAPDLWQGWLDLAATHPGRTVLLGAPLYDHAGPTGQPRYTNSVVGLTDQTSLAALQAGDLALRYDKHHLVPFGEFVPTGFRWLVEALHIPLGDFDRGSARQRPFAVAAQYVAANICFEDVFGEELLAALRPSEDADGDPGATILVNLSNLGWFGDSWALRQHLQIARLRARETARPMLRATNTGTTAAIGPDGRVLIQADPLAARVIGLPVQGMTGLTPYARWGNTPVLLAVALLLGAAWARRRATCYHQQPHLFSKNM